MADISVLLPAPAGVEVGATVRDLLRQSVPGLEILVLSSGEVAFDADERARLVPVHGASLGEALNAGLAAASGTFLARATPGDLNVPERLAHQAMLLRSSAELAFVAAGWRALAADGAELRVVRPPAGDSGLRAAMAEGDAIGHPTALMRREAVQRIGGWRPAFDGVEEYDLMLRLLDRHAGSCVPNALVDYTAPPSVPDWRSDERHILAELAAIAARDRRQAGRPDHGDGEAAADRALLHRMGMPDDEITRIVLDRALSMALAAGEAADWRGMREAARLGLQQDGAPAATRSRLRGLWLRSFARRRPEPAPVADPP